MPNKDRTQSGLPICANCQYSEWVYYGRFVPRVSRCTRRRWEKVDYISGGPIEMGVVTCKSERGSASPKRCGKSGRFFTPKPPSLLVRLLKAVFTEPDPWGLRR